MYALGRVALWASGWVTVTETLPSAVPAGARTVSLRLVLRITWVPSRSPNFTVAPSSKFAPFTVTSVLPDSGP
ncbi:MAG: hypothetical protein H6Q89_5742 [Myxococcaceae bacterium]|nr:hypothetical protein [Myxococcaceae bacterium]